MARDTCRSSSETHPVADAPIPRSPAGPGSPPAGPSASWEESFPNLHEIARGVELDGAVPGEATLIATKRFLSGLAARGLRAPVVGELSDQGVTVEFPGAGESARLTFVVEDDGSRSPATNSPKDDGGGASPRSTPPCPPSGPLPSTAPDSSPPSDTDPDAVGRHELFRTPARAGPDQARSRPGAADRAPNVVSPQPVYNA